MLSSRGALLTARCLHNGKGRPWKALGHRNLSSLFPSNPHVTRAQSVITSPKLPQPPRSLPSSILSRASLRFTSTTPNTLTKTTITSNPAETTTLPTNDAFLPDEPLLSADTYIPPLEEHIGFLHELGITHGWGPTSTYQWLLEHVYVYSGLGWAPSIIISALIIRLSLVKIFYNAADTGGKMTALTPQLQPIQQRMAEAKRTGDQQAVSEMAMELRKLYRTSGVKFWRMFLPLVFQIPLAFGTFRCLNHMSSLPVPGLESSGFLWITDLTVSDPLMILPLTTTAAFYFSFKFGGDLGAPQNASGQSMRLIMQYVLPAVSGIFMLFWPAAMQISFLTTSLFSLTQSWAFRQPKFRKLLHMTPLAKPAKPAGESPTYLAPTTMAAAAEGEASRRKGFLGGAFSEIRGAMGQLRSDANRKLNESEGLGGHSRLTRRELKDARAYERRRRKEIEMENEMRKNQRLGNR